MPDANLRAFPPFRFQSLELNFKRADGAVVVLHFPSELGDAKLSKLLKPRHVVGQVTAPVVVSAIPIFDGVVLGSTGLRGKARRGGGKGARTGLEFGRDKGPLIGAMLFDSASEKKFFPGTPGTRW